MRWRKLAFIFFNKILNKKSYFFWGIGKFFLILDLFNQIKHVFAFKQPREKRGCHLVNTEKY